MMTDQYVSTATSLATYYVIATIECVLMTTTASRLFLLDETLPSPTIYKEYAASTIDDRPFTSPVHLPQTRRGRSPSPNSSSRRRPSHTIRCSLWLYWRSVCLTTRLSKTFPVLSRPLSLSRPGDVNLQR